MNYTIKISILALFAAVFIIMTGCSAGETLPESQQLTGESRTNMRSANLDLGTGVYDRALERYLDVVEENPDHVEALKKIGDIYYHFADQDRSKAVEYYGKAYDYYKKALSAHEGIEEEGPFPSLDEYAEEAEKLLRSSWTRTFHLGQNLYEEEQIDDALHSFYQLAETAPDSTQTYIMIATIYQEQGEAGKAVNYFEKIASMDDQDTISRTNLAHHHLRNQEFERALRWYKELAELRPNEPSHQYNIGIAYSGLEKFDESMAAFEKAFELDEDYIDAIIEAGYIAFSNQRFETAVDHFKTAIEHQPENDQLYMFMIYSLNNLERFEEMLDYGLQWHELDETNVDAVRFTLLAALRTDNAEIQEEFAEKLEELEGVEELDELEAPE